MVPGMYWGVIPCTFHLAIHVFQYRMLAKREGDTLRTKTTAQNIYID